MSLNDCRAKWFLDATGIIKRFFTPLLGSGVQRYEVDTPPSFNAGFSIEVDIAGGAQNDKKIISFKDSNNRVFNINTNNSGAVNFFSTGGGGLRSIIGTTVVLDNKLHNIKVVYDNTAPKVSVFVDGVLNVEAGVNSNQIPNLTDISAMKFGVEASNNGGGFTGHIANIKVINDGVLAIDSPLDKQYSAAAPTVINNADANNPLTAVNLDNAGSAFTSSDTYGWLGENNVGAPTRISDDWTNNGDGSYTIDTPDGNYGDCELQFGVSEVGFTYFVEVTVNEPVGNSSLRLRNCDPNIDFRTAGDYSGSVVAASSACPVINRRGGARPFIQTISNISNRQVLEVAS